MNINSEHLRVTLTIFNDWAAREPRRSASQGGGGV